MDCNLCNQTMTPWLKMPVDPKKNCLSLHDSFYFCNNCSLGAMVPLPSVEQIDDFYMLESYYTQTHGHMPNVKKNVFDKLLTKLSYWLDEGDERQAKDFKRLFNRECRALDIGSGDGSKLIAYNNFGWKTFGIEPDARAASQKISNTINVYQGTAEYIPESIKQEKYDFISMTHVLEHCLNPSLAIKNIYQLLNNKGLFWCEVPNCGCAHFKKFTICSEMFDAPRHTHFFDEKSLHIVLENNGFIIEDVYFHGFTRHHDKNWRLWEKRIYQQVKKVAPELKPLQHSYMESLSLLIDSVIASRKEKYDCVGVVARKL